MIINSLSVTTLSSATPLLKINLTSLMFKHSLLYFYPSKI